MPLGFLFCVEKALTAGIELSLSRRDVLVMPVPDEAVVLCCCFAFGEEHCSLAAPARESARKWQS